MRHLVLLDSARADLLDIFEYLARQSGSRAVGRRFVNSLQEKCGRLAGLPGTLGRPRPDLRPDLRSFAFNGYVIFFRYHGAAFEVVNIFEGHRDIIAYFKDDEV